MLYKLVDFFNHWQIARNVFIYRKEKAKDGVKATERTYDGL